MKPAPVFKQRFFDNNGDPLVDGKVYTYVANTSTPLGTYSTQDGAANQNPVQLDGNGEADIWFDPALSYKVTLTDSDDVPIYTVDEVSLLVDSDQLADDSVTEDKIEDGAVTLDKLGEDVVLGTGEPVVSSSSSTYSFTGDGTSNWHQPTNLSISITTTGRPVMLMLIPASGSLGQLSTSASSGQTYGAILFCKFTRDGSDIAKFVLGGHAAALASGSLVAYMTPPYTVDVDASVGMHTYTFQLTASTGQTISALEWTLVAYEL